MNEHYHRPERGEGSGEDGLHPALAAAMHAEHEHPTEAEAPDVRTVEPTVDDVERSSFATHRDPSNPAKATPSHRPTSAPGSRASVTWVRPTDLIAQGTARVAAVGIDLRAELTRRLRAASGDAARRTGRVDSERTQRLPDLARQHQRTSPQRTAERSGLGTR